jgi:cyclopropane-fatty-acyl-phospholipid synthase
MAGDWEAGDLTGVLTAFARELTTLIPPRLQRLRDLYVAHHPAQEQGSPEGARRNIARHYDLSNDLFASFLDPTMTYSSALFPSDPPAGGWDELAAAQQRKIDRLLDKVGVREGTELVEIGTGWGELALRAAARGARVTSVTLSEEQRALALRRIADAGLADRVRVELRDYRDVTGSYDALVSVEMIEAVGYRYWPTYFATIDRLLRPGGRAGLQAITMPHDRMMASRDTYTWIHKYIFPGGLIPSVQSVTENVGRQPGLRIVDAHAFGAHYAATLRLWRERFDAAAPEVAALGFDDTFRRMWRLYLAYSEAGFRSGYLDVYQFVLAKGERA